MKKVVFAILLGVVALALSTCLTSNRSRSLSSVHLGMSTYEVTVTAGPPDRILEHTVPNGKRVEWIYLIDSHQSVLLFENDILISIML